MLLVAVYPKTALLIRLHQRWIVGAEHRHSFGSLLQRSRSCRLNVWRRFKCVILLTRYFLIYAARSMQMNILTNSAERNGGNAAVARAFLTCEDEQA